MLKENKTVQMINRYFTDEEFLLNIVFQENSFNNGNLAEALYRIICYYIASRDTEYYSNYSDIRNKLLTIFSQPVNKTYKNRILYNGFLTSSFPRGEENYIKKYGFDFEKELQGEEKKYYENIKNGLNLMEKVNKCIFIKRREDYKFYRQITDREIFMTIPGRKTVHYSTYCPERFYLGPIDYNLFFRYPIIFGESEDNYLTRIFLHNQEKYGKNYSPSEEELIKKTIAHYAKGSSIAFINISSLKNVPISSRHYDEEKSSELINYINSINSSKLLHEVFTSEFFDTIEEGNCGDFVSLIPKLKECEYDIASFPNIYELKQKYLAQKGAREGNMYTYKNCVRTYPSIISDESIKKLYKKL